MFQSFLLLFIIFTASVHCQDPPKALKINVISRSNGGGLEVDQHIIKEALENLGCTVNCVEFWKESAQKPKADINIFFEMIDPELLSEVSINWLVSNPEWFRQDVKLLDRIDLILCRTKEVERVFQDLGKKTYLLRFTSPDSYQEKIKKDYTSFLHTPGQSDLKGTNAIIRVWNNSPSLPHLTLIKYGHLIKEKLDENLANAKEISIRLPTEAFRSYQNRCGIHLCPSETEGFGHYIMEAMSTKAVVITTNAPPMNEFITDPRCLVSCKMHFPLRLATGYCIDEEELVQKIKEISALPTSELEAIGLANRETYLKISQEFRERLQMLIKDTKL